MAPATCRTSSPATSTSSTSKASTSYAPAAVTTSRPRSTCSAVAGPAPRRALVGSGTPWPPRAASAGDTWSSHEILAGADDAAVRRALDALPRPRAARRAHGARPRTADPRRMAGAGQAPRPSRLRRIRAAHQEAPRHSARADPVLAGAGRAQDPPTWGADLPPDRVHVVTVPPRRSSRPACWDRFAEVIGSRSTAPEGPSKTTNASLGGAEVTLLRRLNAALAERELPRGRYVEWVRETVVKEVLAGRRDSAARHASLRGPGPGSRRSADGWVEEIRDLGVDVVGDLATSRPVWPDDADELGRPRRRRPRPGRRPRDRGARPRPGPDRDAAGASPSPPRAGPWRRIARRLADE